MKVVSLSFFCLLVVYLFVFQIQAIWAFTIDDMYITLRYAREWAVDGAIVWNVGESPVEGYSNFSFLLLARLCDWLQVDPVWGLKAMGVFSLALVSLGLFLLTALFVKVSYAWIPVVWLLAYRGEVIWAASGLETTFYQCTLVFCVYCLLKGLHEEKRRYMRIAGALLALLGLTRPEGGVVAACCLLMWAVYVWRRPGLKPLCFDAVLVFAIIYLPYLVWRVVYFGYVFPNPVYCKASAQQFMGVLDRQFLSLAWPFLCCSVPLLWQRPRYVGCLFLLMPTCLYSVLCVSADPIVAFDNRLFLPALALLFPLALIGLSGVLRSQRVFYVVSFLLFVFAVPKMSLEDYRYFTKNPVLGERLRSEVSHWLGVHTTPNQQIVLADSGLIPYSHPELRFIDSYCLNDVKMAHDNTQARYMHFCETLLERQPDYIILTAWIHDGKTEYTPADACLSVRLQNTNDYTLLNVFRSYSQDRTVYQYQIYAKRYSPNRSLNHTLGYD